ncbi:hypothetical protein F5I97DRAFT_1806429 [Phlebopus sp. FC_14]|nr:hypothetical protein F5I97DRAFT_1806429 [Phlebopus sp. FC_14]
MHALIETLPVQPPLHSVPFPSVSVSGRSSSAGPEEVLRPGSGASYLDLQVPQVLARSSASFNSQLQLNDGTTDEKTNWSAVRPPSPDRISRFDPKVNRVRSMSNATVDTMTKNALAGDNPFSLRPPSPSRSSRFDPKARARTMSVNSRGTHAMLESGLDADSRRDRPYSTVELLRPKVLVMPSPLQTVAPPPPPPPAIRPRNGFSTSTDGPPLPPGARSARPSSNLDLASVPIASNSFTPNPRASLSLSQLAFRNTLLVGGQRDIAFSDIDRHLPCAEREGEQARFEEEEEEQQVSPIATSIALPTVPPATEVEIRRPAGKLYGRSLIDNLEHRKAEMKQKARTFQGDDRPSMMSRGQIRRSSALVDPTTIGAHLMPQNLDARPQAQTLNRHNSENSKPLVDKSDERFFATSASAPDMKSRSVFGVDTLWDREMAKLKEIEALERAETEERKKRDQEKADRRELKNKRGKSKRKGNHASPQPECTPSPEGPSESRVSSEPPTLPAIQQPVLRRAPVRDIAEESESESDNDSVPLGQTIGRTIERVADSWVAESSDEGNGPRRTTGVGPRYPNKGVSSTPQIPPLSHDDGDDSEEDLPLITAVERVAKRTAHLPLPRLVDDDDDEDRPLAAVISEGKLSLPSFSFDNLSRGHQVISNDDDDDDQPLGLRTSHVPLASQISLAFTGGEEDDDKPLAFHPEQRRRIQHQILAQAHQQQHMMMQAQMHNSIYFGAPAMLGSGFFGPSMGAPLAMMGMPVAPSPPPVHDAAKFGRVDKWRRDVAVEGEH